jgi:hypothetical protein
MILWGKWLGSTYKSHKGSNPPPNLHVQLPQLTVRVPLRRAVVPVCPHRTGHFDAKSKPVYDHIDRTPDTEHAQAAASRARGGTYPARNMPTGTTKWPCSGHALHHSVNRCTHTHTHTHTHARTHTRPRGQPPSLLRPHTPSAANNPPPKPLDPPEGLPEFSVHAP